MQSRPLFIGEGKPVKKPAVRAIVIEYSKTGSVKKLLAGTGTTDGVDLELSIPAASVFTHQFILKLEIKGT